MVTSTGDHHPIYHANIRQFRGSGRPSLCVEPRLGLQKVCQCPRRCYGTWVYHADSSVHNKSWQHLVDGWMKGLVWGFLLTSKMIQVKSQRSSSSITSLLRLTKFFVWLKKDSAYLLKYLQKHGVLSMSKPCRLLNQKKKLQHHPQARMAVQFFGRWRTSWTRSVPGHRVNFCTVQVRALVTNRQHQSHKDGTRKFQHSKWSVDVNKLAPLEGFRMRDLLWSLSYPILNGLKHPYPPKKSTWKSSGSKPATWNLN